MGFFKSRRSKNAKILDLQQKLLEHSEVARKQAELEQQNKLLTSQVE